MAFIISRTKRTLGAFILSVVLYLFPSAIGCGRDHGDLYLLDTFGGADGSYGPPSCLTCRDAGPDGFGGEDGSYGPPCSTDEDCYWTYGEDWYCSKVMGECEWGKPEDGGVDVGQIPCGTDQACQQMFGIRWYCDNSQTPPICSNSPQNGDR